ncbi:MAG: aldo/keto reductase [Clostridia bacterium]|nr:aldo/keto reductase [Clostridia bacterium]
MIYRDFQDLKLSNLGFGMMRLPTLDSKKTEIDMEQLSKMVAYAIEHGVNYFDTAWGYHEGMSELAAGEVLSKYPRDSFYLASKFPGYDTNNFPKVKEIFEKQLEKCKTEYFDFYLFHNVCDTNIEYYLDPKYGVDEYLCEQKRLGRIKHLGMSHHGTFDAFKAFLEKYGDHIEFCQLQLNYIDWDFQEAKLRVELLKKYNIPVWVMEPLRGGKLVKIDDKGMEKLSALRPGASAVEWAFRYLQTIPDVKVILSGMSTMDQIVDNVRIFEEDKPLNDEEMAALYDTASNGILAGTLPCTGCRYCTEYCPMGLDIPMYMVLYNEEKMTPGTHYIKMALRNMPADKLPTVCLGCGACEAVCPQSLKIADMMTEFQSFIK